MDKSLRKNKLLKKIESIWKRERQTDRGELEEKNVERPLEK